MLIPTQLERKGDILLYLLTGSLSFSTQNIMAKSCTLASPTHIPKRVLILKK